MLVCAKYLLCFGFHILWAEPTGSGMPLSTAYAHLCAMFVALARCVSSSALPAGLEFLSVEALQWFSHKGPHSETPVPSRKSDGVLFPYQYTFTMFVGSDFCFSEFHVVIREASSTSLPC